MLYGREDHPVFLLQSVVISTYRRGNDCVTWFTEELKNLAHNVETILSANVPMADFTRYNWQKFNSATHCHICEKHSNCNLNYKNSYCILIVFHNLSDYDAYFIIKDIVTAYKGRTELLPIIKNKYILFSKYVYSIKNDQKKTCIKLRFIDSFKFFSISLEKLASVNVWQRFSIQTLGEYNDLYLKIDVLLLADIFENFWGSCIISYGLDLAYYYTLLMYFDNLYSWAMCQPLLYANFRWVEVDNFVVTTIAMIDSSTNYVLGVDLEYAQHLHQLNTNFRTLANEFEKNLFKLMNNAVFGKIIENVRNHVDVRLVTHWDGVEAMIAKPNFHSRNVFIEMKFDKPIYVGMCILDISDNAYDIPPANKKVPGLIKDENKTINFLTKSEKYCASWLSAYHHGLQWEDGMIPYSTAKCLITMTVIGAKENDDDKVLIYVKGREKREWLADIFDSDNLTIETLDTDYEDIDSLHNLDVTNTMRCV
ncbi:hypothetical protein ALC56_00594 [Trachymyrmex septentrionalis]|uniref:DNA-directed DNA polymerase n=1 Tax=Trachymyrmex septentrionalis TaxID=34720 RepID=A0A195FXA0_9HYME|nr:hypothetical protein ALC56_00594 [Trachymyrmex septentrionalis]